MTVNCYQVMLLAQVVERLCLKPRGRHFESL